MNSQCFQGILKGGYKSKDADGAGDSGRHGQHPIGLCGDPVTTGGGIAAHGDNHRNIVVAGFGNGIADYIRGEGAATGAVHAQHNCLNPIILIYSLKDIGNAVTTHSALWLVAIENIAAGHHQCHQGFGFIHRVQFAQLDIVEVGGHGDAGKITVGGGQYLFQVLIGFSSGGHHINQSLVQCQGGCIAIGVRQSQVHIVNQVIEGAAGKAAQMFYLGAVVLPQGVQQIAAVGAGFVRHTVTHKGFHCALVFADPEDMHIDLQLIQRFLVVVAVGAKAGKHNAAHGVENNLIGVGGKEILWLGKVIADGDNRLAAFLEALQGAADLFQLGDTAAGQVVGIQKNMGDTGIVLGVVKGIHYIPDQGFRIPLVALGEGLGEGVHIGALVYQHTAGCKVECPLVGNFLYIPGKHTADNDKKKDQEEQADQVTNNIDNFSNKVEEPTYKAFFLTHLDSFSLITG